MVPPQQDWPCGSNTLTAHKQRQGLQMTACHSAGSLICNLPSSSNRCLGCHRLWGLPYGEVYNKTKTINLSVSGTALLVARAAVSCCVSWMWVREWRWASWEVMKETVRVEGISSALMSDWCILWTLPCSLCFFAYVLYGGLFWYPMWFMSI